MSNNESHLAIFLTSTEGMSRGRLNITLAALQYMDSKALNSLFVQHAEIGSAYVTEGKITLKYRCKIEFLGKKGTAFDEIWLVNEPSLEL